MMGRAACRTHKSARADKFEQFGTSDDLGTTWQFLFMNQKRILDQQYTTDRRRIEIQGKILRERLDSTPKSDGKIVKLEDPSVVSKTFEGPSRSREMFGSSTSSSEAFESPMASRRVCALKSSPEQTNLQSKNRMRRRPINEQPRLSRLLIDSSLAKRKSKDRSKAIRQHPLPKWKWPSLEIIPIDEYKGRSAEKTATTESAQVAVPGFHDSLSESSNLDSEERPSRKELYGLTNMISVVDLPHSDGRSRFSCSSSERDIVLHKASTPSTSHRKILHLRKSPLVVQTAAQSEVSSIFEGPGSRKADSEKPLPREAIASTNRERKVLQAGEAAALEEHLDPLGLNTVRQKLEMLKDCLSVSYRYEPHQQAINRLLAQTQALIRVADSGNERSACAQSGFSTATTQRLNHLENPVANLKVRGQVHDRQKGTPGSRHIRPPFRSYDGVDNPPRGGE
ncbi:MAG: hypothetical protein M1836_007066 [Candelina mexicana]|nr:MAG: hypothetical protein M1836_007066 [Candelina mexicana]